MTQCINIIASPGVRIAFRCTREAYPPDTLCRRCAGARRGWATRWLHEEQRRTSENLQRTEARHREVRTAELERAVIEAAMVWATSPPRVGLGNALVAACTALRAHRQEAQ